MSAPSDSSDDEAERRAFFESLEKQHGTKLTYAMLKQLDSDQTSNHPHSDDETFIQTPKTNSDKKTDRENELEPEIPYAPPTPCASDWVQPHAYEVWIQPQSRDDKSAELHIDHGPLSDSQHEDQGWMEPTFNRGAFTDPQHEDCDWVEPRIDNGGFIERISARDGEAIESQPDDGGWLQPKSSLDGEIIEPQPGDNVWIEPRKSIPDTGEKWIDTVCGFDEVFNPLGESPHEENDKNPSHATEMNEACELPDDHRTLRAPLVDRQNQAYAHPSIDQRNELNSQESRDDDPSQLGSKNMCAVSPMSAELQDACKMEIYEKPRIAVPAPRRATQNLHSLSKWLQQGLAQRFPLGFKIMSFNAKMLQVILAIIFSRKKSGFVRPMNKLFSNLTTHFLLRTPNVQPHTLSMNQYVEGMHFTLQSSSPVVSARFSPICEGSMQRKDRRGETRRQRCEWNCKLLACGHQLENMSPTVVPYLNSIRPRR